MRSKITTVLIAVGAVCPVTATVTVNEWNVNDTNKWFYNINTGTITDNDPDPDVLSFEAYDDVTGDPVDIDRIEVTSAGLTGTVAVRVDADPASARTRGAARSA